MSGKIFIHIDPDEQLKRFNKRLDDPLKRWKMVDEDYRNRDMGCHADAIDDMVERTHTEQAPWSIIPGNSKRYARIAVQDTYIKAVSSF